MENNKNKEEEGKSKNEQAIELAQDKTGSDKDTYKKTMIGTGTEKSDETFDGTYRQSNEQEIENRDTNDGDANTENNY